MMERASNKKNKNKQAIFISFFSSIFYKGKHFLSVSIDL